MGAKGTSTFGELVRLWRTRRRLTQEELASRAGLSQGAVEMIEGGQRTDPHLSTVAALALALGVPTASIIPESLSGHPGAQVGTQPVKWRAGTPDGDRLRRMWEEGLSGRAIAAAFGVSRPAIYMAARQMGLPRRKSQKSSD